MKQLSLSKQIEELACDIKNGATGAAIKITISMDDLCAGLNGEPVMLEAYAHLFRAAEILTNCNHRDLAEMVNIIN